MQSVNTYENKASILARMMHLAADIQGVGRAELLDPVVILFVESLAEEFYHLSSEVGNLETRLMDKLSNMLVAEMETIAHPPHSLLHAAALEGKVALSTLTAFHCSYDTSNTKSNLAFYPVCNTNVYNGMLRYFVYDRYFYAVDKELTKTLLTRGGNIHQKAENSFWIGLALDDAITNIENLSFYFNFSRGYKSEESLKQLGRLKWKFEEQTLIMTNGLYENKIKYENRHLDLFSDYKHANRINKRLKEKYDKHFVSIGQELVVEDKKEKLPEELIASFPENFIKTLNEEKLIWFEIICPADFTDEMKRAIEIGINIFPVTAKKLVNKTLEVVKHLPIIPMETEDGESFLSIHSLNDSNGRNYYDIPLQDMGEEKYGVYSMRHGGYEKFNTRDAREFLSNMIHQLDAESAYFFKESDASKIEENVVAVAMNKMIRRLIEAKEVSKVHKEIKSYLLLEQDSDYELYYLKYWTTNHRFSETIREGTIVRTELGVGMNPRTSFLLKPLSGGKQTPSQTERNSLYRDSLTEHPLIISDEDIEDFCLKEFSELVDKVKINQAYENSKNPKLGFLRLTVVQLYVHSHRQNKRNPNTELMIKEALQERSPATFNYRVIIK